MRRFVLIDGPDHYPTKTPFVRVVEFNFESLFIVVRHPLVPEYGITSFSEPTAKGEERAFRT